MKAIKLSLLLLFCAAIGTAQVRITEVNPTTNEVTLTNMGAAEDVGSWWLCNFPAYDQISTLPASGSTILGMGDSVTLTWSDLTGADGECGLYISNNFAVASEIHDYMEWGVAGQTREPVAVSAGVWCTGEAITGGHPYVFSGGAADFCVGFWSETPPLPMVTFRVDMNNYVPAFGYVNVSGSWNGWCGDCNQMTDADLDGVWEATLPIADGSYDWKFSLDNWAADEALATGAGFPCTTQNGDFVNRSLVVAGADADLGVVCWESCQDCPGAGVPGCMDSAANNYNSMATEADGTCEYFVTFQVNMNNYGGAFTTPEVNGQFNGWCGGCGPIMDDADLDGIWVGTGLVQEGWYEYKYATDAWTDQENLVGAGACTVTNFGNTNRFVQVTSDVTQPVVCWGTCADCVPGEGCIDSTAANFDSTASVDNGTCEYLVTFSVDMNNYAGAFTTPEVNGTWNAWCGGCNALTDVDMDGVWEGTFQILNGNHEFKYAVDAWADQENFDGTEPCVVGADPFWNRELIVSGNATLSTVCWGSCDACPVPMATFRVDMNNYVPAFGYVNVSGEWNGWCGDCNQLTDADLDGIWEGTFEIPNGTYDFKYSLDNWAAQEALSVGAGFPCTTQQGDFINREMTIDGGDLDLGVVCWESCQACPGAGVPGCMDSAADNYDSLATESDGTCQYFVTFQVNMNSYGGAFTTAEVNGAFNGWCGGCGPIMDDADLDGIWVGTGLVQEGWYEYKFAVDAWADQEDLVGAGACTVTNFGNTNRYIQVSSDTTQPVVCWGSCEDCVVGAGCTDSLAANYDSTATIDDGSCEYVVTFSVNMNDFGGGFTSVAPFGTFNGWCTTCNPLTDVDLDGIWEGTIQMGNGNYEFLFAVDGPPGQEVFDGTESCVVGSDPFWNRELIVAGDTMYGTVCYNSCEDCPAGVSGCMDSTAANYDSLATIDDGSCEYLITFIVDMNQYAGTFTTPEVNGTWNGWCGGCQTLTDADLDGVWEGTFQVPNGNIEFKFATDSWTDQENFDGTEPCVVGADPFWNRGLSVSGNATYGVVCWNSCDACPAIEGCTDTTADNYDSTATIDDGSCIYLGCTYPNADNYDSTANDDDGSCIFPTNDCPTDLNEDFVTNTQDLLIFLAAFGQPC